MPRFVSIADDDEDPKRAADRRAGIQREVEAELGRRGMHNTHTEAPQGARGMREHALGRHGAPAPEAPTEDDLLAQLDADDRAREEVLSTLQALSVGGYTTSSIREYVMDAIVRQGLSPREVIRRVYQFRGHGARAAPGVAESGTSPLLSATG